MPTEPPDRRRFLRIATCAIGGGAGLAVGLPVLRVLAHPLGATTVTSPRDPLVLGRADGFAIGAPPQRVELIAPLVQDAWAAARDVVLGAAWIRRTAADRFDARSAVCPHLGCAVGYDAARDNFLCPCHDSRFALAGDVLSGPSERGLDPLPIEVAADGHLRVTWIRYRLGARVREPA